MTFCLRVLILEDREADAQLVVHELRAAGFDPEWERVEDEAQFLARLDPPPNLICADYSMPQFDAVRALALLRQRGLDVPFIIVSGSIGEETAVAAMRLGADDYLLKDRLARLGEAVKTALEKKRLRDEKRALEQGLRDYMLTLAHELRGPLAPLRNGIEVARRADAPTRERALETARRAVQNLARLVDDLLEASRITGGRLQVRPVRMDLARLARTAAKDRRGLFEEAGVALAVDTPDTPVWVLGDEVRLAQVLHNLLDNGARFTDPGGRVRLSVRAEGQRAVVGVEDTGIGVGPEMLPRLFEPFAQADRSLDRSRGGLGLGLAIVKGLVEAHRGQVEAASAGAGRGARFTVRLPLEPEPAALAAMPDAHEREVKGLRVLVIEDNRDSADSLRMLLSLLGNHEVEVAYNGRDGVQKALAWKPDLVLSDIGLPGLDGFGVARELRRNPETARARLIAISGYTSDEDRRRSREAGFDHHLGKPADPAELRRLLSAG